MSKIVIAIGSKRELKLPTVSSGRDGDRESERDMKHF